MPRDREAVVSGVATEALRFIRNRREKLVQLRHASMAVNPFLWPMLMELNGYEALDELTTYIIAGHLSDGHATGFGKLVDERIVPNVFGTTKLDAAFRRLHPPLNEPKYGVIDHIVHRLEGPDDLLPLKAGRWSIQLGQAKNMNRDFAQVLEARERGEVDFGRIVIGVLYGKESTLTDKFQIARGIGPHDLTDISKHVDLRVGRDFWSWLNDGVEGTQDWVMDGILTALDLAREELGSAADAVEGFRLSYQAQLESHQGSDGQINWHALLREVNG